MFQITSLGHFIHQKIFQIRFRFSYKRALYHNQLKVLQKQRIGRLLHNRHVLLQSVALVSGVAAALGEIIILFFTMHHYIICKCCYFSTFPEILYVL